VQWPCRLCRFLRSSPLIPVPREGRLFVEELQPFSSFGRKLFVVHLASICIYLAVEKERSREDETFAFTSIRAITHILRTSLSLSRRT
jgi:hypothetical protein